MANNEHGNLRAVSAPVPDLLGLKVIGVQFVNFRRSQNAPSMTLGSREVVESDGARRIESGHDNEEMRLGFSVDKRCCANKVRCEAS